MATGKSIETNGATLQAVQNELHSLDALAQEAQEIIQASTRSIALWLSLPDSAERRGHMLSLCHIIEQHASDVRNTVNATAEMFGANFRDEAREEQRRRFRAAVAAN